MIQLNGNIDVLSMRTWFPGQGAWFADLEIDLLSAPNASLTSLGASMPTGKVTITISPDAPTGVPTTMTCTVDPLATGRFLGKGKVRVVGGGAGWNMHLPRQQFAQEPLTSTTLYAATASAIGETVVDPAPVTFPTGYERIAGPASRVFENRAYYVDPITGITNVAAWPAASPPSDLQVLSFDPCTMTAQVASSNLLVPGMSITDTTAIPRWDGALSVVDVEQVFSPTGTRATIWVSAVSAQSRLIGALTHLTRELTRRDLTRHYQYRVVSQQGATLTLQAVTANLGAPDSLMIPVWTAPGITAMFTPGATVLVVFADGNPGSPKVVVADPTVPISIALCGGTSPVGRVGDQVQVTITPTNAAQILTGASPGAPCSAAGPITVTGTITAGAPKVTA